MWDLGLRTGLEAVEQRTNFRDKIREIYVRK
jgi:hypothetical protein